MVTITKQIFENSPLTYGVIISEEDDRLDCAWFNPVIENKMESLQESKRNDRKLVKLRVIADVSGGKRLPKGTVISESESSLIPYIRATDIKNLKVNLDTAIKIPKEIHQAIQNYQLKQDDIVITIVGTIGEVGILKENVDVCDFTENIAKARIKDDSVLPLFLLHFLDSEFGKIQTERFSVGSLQYKLSLQSCRNLEIYLPFSDNSFDNYQQKRILNEVYFILKQVEKQKEDSDNYIREAKSVVVRKLGIFKSLDIQDKHYFDQVLDNDPSSRLDALFNNPLRKTLLKILRKYPNKQLGKLVKPQKNNKITPSDFYRLVELEQIDDNTGRITEAKEVLELGSEKILLNEGNILISKLQPEKGKVVIVSKKYDGCVGSSELIPFVLSSYEVSLEYLWAVLRSDFVLKQWEHELTGSSRMRIGPNEINNTIIPIPDKKTQDEIVAEIQNKIAISDRTLEEADTLFSKAKEQFVKLLVS
jgi:restriction endonuclease S subunit